VLVVALLTLAAATTALAQKSGTPTQLTEALRKVSARYARTDERIEVLVGRRLKPEPLPASMPNPFYRGVEPTELAAQAEPVPEAVPAAPDITDADTLARIAPTLRFSGYVIRNQQPYVAINSIVCKVGDVVPIAGPEATLFIQVRAITPSQVTVGLNDAELSIPLKL
jgi:hypothetical protein